MIALVTGGAGFIGSHLVERLLVEGHEVRVLDNFSTGRRENLVHLKGNKRLEIVEGDLSDFGFGASNFQHFFRNVGWVFHLSAFADIVPSIVRPLDYHSVNVDGTVNVLEAARKEGVRKFIYAASSSCYGIPDKCPTDENAEIRPQYPYALTKYIGETYVLHWGSVYKLPVVSLRLFNVYGVRSRTTGTYGAVFGVFLAQKLAGLPFTVVGDGKQTRDFTYVTDIVEAFVKAAKSDVTNEVFNVGSGNTYSINHLIELLEGEVVHIPKRPGEPDCIQADITKIKKMLGWKPKVSFEEGVRRILVDIDYWKNAPVWTAAKIKKETKEWFKYLLNPLI
ncbi:SDR family oxidoreductase [Candidatus Gottesmanbacteria bacterium]|nr:SDR family oxidoreductase [Candidatus Gottesmanbacteria bacterium]